MSIHYKDYYQILEVSRTATADEIRKAFRRLARKHHPDVAQDQKKGEQKFKEINEAYEVLSDPEKRKKYDQLGPSSARSHQGPSPGGSPFHRYEFPTEGTGGVEFGGTGFSDFFEMFFGGGASHWSDSGSFSQGPRSASTRGGPRRGRDMKADIMVTLEEALHGSVRQITLRRHREPNRQQPETYQVTIPSGVREGQLIRMANQGEPSPQGGPPGDLFLRVRLESHPHFHVENSNLFYELSLAPWESALGTKIQIPTLEKPILLTISPGTPSGKKLRIPHKGLPQKGGKRGDLFVEVTIAIPDSLTEKEKKLWLELQSISQWNPRTSS